MIRNLLGAWRIQWRAQLQVSPFGTAAAAAALLLGTIGAIVGDEVSQGMTISLRASASVVAHLWGVLFATGGALKLAGLLRGHATPEVAGLWMMAGGYAFYSLTVLTGLGVHGLAAGIISAALAVGSLLKIRSITRAAVRAAQQRDTESP